MAAIATSGIAVQAFRLLEMSPISSFGDDSEQASSAEEQYPEALRMCLEANDWSFASTLASLPAVDEDSGDEDLPHVYTRPGDLVRLIDVKPASVLYRLDEDRLRADQAAPLRIRYTRLVTNEARLPGMFKTAVSYQLAALLAPRWTTSRNRADSLQAQADNWLGRAMKADRGSASSQRYDGRARQADWRGEAIR